MTVKHTPGPWFLDTSLHIYGTSAPQPSGGWPGAAIIEHPHVCTAKTIGDARLIAAAPELLEVAHSILADDMLQYLPAEYVAKVRAVIAKATGSPS